MARYLRRRLFHSALTLLILLIGLFFAFRVLGDPVTLMLEDDYTPAQYNALRERFGYDRPIQVQFVEYMLGVFQGDFGDSIRQARPAMELVLDRVPRTFFLGGIAFAVSLLGIPFGIIAASRPRSAVDQVLNTGSFAAMSAPNFWLALLGIHLFAVALGWLPTSGFGGFTPSGFKYLVLPVAVLSLNSGARFAQFTRTAVMEELSRQYVVTAHSKGLPSQYVLRVHVMKNAGIAIATLAGVELSTIINGSVIIETVFGWPGIGNLMITAVQQRDLPLVTATVVVVLTLVMIINFSVDMLYAQLDPRIKYQ
jgi:peptide/nickel transport system permease protein